MNDVTLVEVCGGSRQAIVLGLDEYNDMQNVIDNYISIAELTELIEAYFGFEPDLFQLLIGTSVVIFLMSLATGKVIRLFNRI